MTERMKVGKHKSQIIEGTKKEIYQINIVCIQLSLVTSLNTRKLGQVEKSRNKNMFPI